MEIRGVRGVDRWLGCLAVQDRGTKAQTGEDMQVRAKRPTLVLSVGKLWWMSLPHLIASGFKARRGFNPGLRAALVHVWRRRRGPE